MKSPFRVQFVVLLAWASLTATPNLFAADVAPVPPAAPTPPVPPPRIVKQVEIEVDDDDESPVREALREAQDDLRGAHEEVARAMRDVQRHVKTFRIDAGGPNASRLLVVPAADATGEQVAQIREDLTIMSRLLQKTASPDGQSQNRFRFDFGDLRLGGRADFGRPVSGRLRRRLPAQRGLPAEFSRGRRAEESRGEGEKGRSLGKGAPRSGRQRRTGGTRRPMRTRRRSPGASTAARWTA